MARVGLWILALFGLAASAGGAVALTDCPPQVSPDNPIVTEDWRGMPLAREYYLNPKGVWFKLPFGYLNPWPDRVSEPLLRQRTPENPNVPGLNQATGIGFAFWMPSLRWPERNRFNVPDFRACEDGRPAPSAREYIVEAEIEWPWLPDPQAAGYVLPDQRLENTVEYMNVRLEDATEEHGLLRLDEQAPRGRVFYHSQPGDPIRLDLDCTGPTDDVPNPSCNGNAWWPDERLDVWLHFSRLDLPDWRAIADAARTLAHRWRREAKSD